jgi:hypothetical protein
MCGGDHSDLYDLVAFCAWPLFNNGTSVLSGYVLKPERTRERSMAADGVGGISRAERWSLAGTAALVTGGSKGIG